MVLRRRPQDAGTGTSKRKSGPANYAAYNSHGSKEAQERNQRESTSRENTCQSTGGGSAAKHSAKKSGKKGDGAQASQAEDLPAAFLCTDAAAAHDGNGGGNACNKMGSATAGPTSAQAAAQAVVPQPDRGTPAAWGPDDDSSTAAAWGAATVSESAEEAAHAPGPDDEHARMSAERPPPGLLTDLMSTPFSKTKQHCCKTKKCLHSLAALGRCLKGGAMTVCDVVHRCRNLRVGAGEEFDADVAAETALYSAMDAVERTNSRHADMDRDDDPAHRHNARRARRHCVLQGIIADSFLKDAGGKLVACRAATSKILSASSKALYGNFDIVVDPCSVLLVRIGC